MRKITKILGLGAAAAVAGTLGWNALAQTPFNGGPQGTGPGMGFGMMMGLGGGFGPMAGGFAAPAARLDSLKTELGITAQQQPAWDAYAKVVQDTASSMQARHQGIDMTALSNMSDQDRQAFMTQMWDQREKSFQTVKAAAEDLLGVLDDRQKGRADEILPGLAAPGPGMMRHAGMWWHGTQQGGATR